MLIFSKYMFKVYVPANFKFYQRTNKKFRIMHVIYP